MTDAGAVEKKPGFEASLEALQAIVKKLESGELTLDQALRSFEEGVRLTRACQEYLSAAETKVELLMKANEAGKLEMQPFQPGKP